MKYINTNFILIFNFFKTFLWNSLPIELQQLLVEKNFIQYPVEQEKRQLFYFWEALRNEILRTNACQNSALKKTEKPIEFDASQGKVLVHTQDYLDDVYRGISELKVKNRQKLQRQISRNHSLHRSLSHNSKSIRKQQTLNRQASKLSRHENGSKKYGGSLHRSDSKKSTKRTQSVRIAVEKSFTESEHVNTHTTTTLVNGNDF